MKYTKPETYSSSLYPEVVSTQGSEVETEGVTTRVPAENIFEDLYGQVFELAGEEGIGEGSHDGSDEEVEVASG